MNNYQVNVLTREAWIPVRVKKDLDRYIISQFAGEFGYLTWANSD